MATPTKTRAARNPAAADCTLKLTQSRLADIESGTQRRDDAVTAQPHSRFVVVKVLIEESASPALFERVWSTRLRSRAGIVRTLAEKQLTEQAASHDALYLLRQLGLPNAVAHFAPAPAQDAAAPAISDDIVLKNPPQHQLAPTDLAIRAMDDVEL